MKITDIINEISVISSYIPIEMLECDILSLCHDSRRAAPTCAFFCKTGALTDGHLFAPNAYEKGARIFVAEHELDLPHDAAVIITPNTNTALNTLAVKFYNDPAKELKIIGITGTKGKTTVAISAYKIAVANGIKAGYIGTNGIYYCGKQLETVNTTPDTLELQKTLRDMRNEGVTTVMLEVSSQALWQDRTFGLEFDSCVFTNLYSDHVGGIEHPTEEHYRDSKKKLFEAYKTNRIIINSDSNVAEYMTKDTKCQKIIATSASGDGSCDLYATDVKQFRNVVVPGISFVLHSKVSGSFEVFMPVPGKYNVENALLILSICTSLGIDLENAICDLSTLSVPGRFESIELSSKPGALFIIDYAHNGASLESVIRALRDYSPKRVICLFGSVGGRTQGRRAELGRVAGNLADVLIITSDNPNNEDPMSVIRDIRDAVGNTDKPIYEIADRKEAIKKAHEIADDGDFILLAGKGHENYQLIQGKRIPFSERKILEELDLAYQPI